MTVFLTIYAAVALAYWLFMAYGAFRLNGLPRLSRIPSTRQSFR